MSLTSSFIDSLHDQGIDPFEDSRLDAEYEEFKEGHLSPSELEQIEVLVTG